MNVVVALKVVPDYEQVRMAAGATSLDLGSVPRIPYTFDELALEAALRVKDKDPSVKVTVVCLTAEPDKVREVVKKTLAMGADAAALVSDPAAGTWDSWGQAKVLQAVVAKVGGVGLLSYGIPGIQGEAFGLGNEPGALLGWPVVSYAMSYTKEGEALQVERLLEQGTETVQVPTPAVVTVGKFQWDPRLPTFKGIMASKNKPLDTWSLADLGLDAAAVAPTVKLTAYVAPPARAAGRKVEGEAADLAKEAVSTLRGKAFV